MKLNSNLITAAKVAKGASEIGIIIVTHAKFNINY